jgi:hypothetical protein
VLGSTYPSDRMFEDFGGQETPVVFPERILHLDSQKLLHSYLFLLTKIERQAGICNFHPILLILFL